MTLYKSIYECVTTHEKREHKSAETLAAPFNSMGDHVYIKIESARPYSFRDRAKTILGDKVPKFEKVLSFYVHTLTFNVSVYVSVKPTVVNDHVFTCNVACSGL